MMLSVRNWDLTIINVALTTKKLEIYHRKMGSESIGGFDNVDGYQLHVALTSPENRSYQRGFSAKFQPRPIQVGKIMLLIQNLPSP